MIYDYHGFNGYNKNSEQLIISLHDDYGNHYYTNDDSRLI